MHKSHIFRIVLLLVILYIGYTYISKNIEAHKQQNVAAVAGAANQKAGAPALYPNPALTPGAVLPVTAAQVCVPGYSGTVRNVPQSEKLQVYAEYGVSYPEPHGSYEVDHFISLELGGSNDIQNLWPEPAQPVPGFHEKDKAENYLHAEVCAGRMTLSEAQVEISTDWYGVYQKIR